MTTHVDDRTPAQRASHRTIIAGTDRFLSGWGGATGGTSVAAWACRDDDRLQVEAWVRSRGDMRRVRVTADSPTRPYRPSGPAHVHIYVVDVEHPALTAGPAG